MGKPLRTRTSEIMDTTRKVKSAGLAIELDSHAEHLQRARDFAELWYSYSQSLSRATKLLMCGRVVAGNGKKLESTWYCGQASCCARCHYLKHWKRTDWLVKAAAKPIGKTTRKAVYEFLVTFPMPGNHDDLVHYTRAAKELLDYIPEAIVAWNARHKGQLTRRIVVWALGLHLKHSHQGKLLQPHLHLCLVTGPDLVFEAQGFYGLKQYLKEGIDHKLDLHGIQSKIMSDRRGWFGPKSISKEEAVRQHKVSGMTAEELRNVFAYNMRLLNLKDSPEARIEKLKLLEEVGLKYSFKRSRLPGGKKAQPPHEFSPDQLSKAEVYWFPFDGSDKVKVPAAEYRQQHKDKFVKQRCY